MTHPPLQVDRRIGGFAVIGDARTVALITRDGSVEWFCAPRIDSSPLFCAMLDPVRGGSFRIAPPGDCTTSRQYVAETNVLETVFQNGSGAARLTDFMPVEREDLFDAHRDEQRPCRLMRRLDGIAGSIEFEIYFRPTFGFGERETVIETLEGGALAHSEGESITLNSPVALNSGPDGAALGRVRLKPGERLWFALEYQRTARASLRKARSTDADDTLVRTVRAWREWAQQTEYDGDHRAAVRRSALVLKLLSYQPTGAIVAAGSASLPEVIGGVRNWDYRFAWLRDASLILEALHAIGHRQSALAFFEWLESLSFGPAQGGPRVFYEVDGGTATRERNVANFSGWRDSQPVRVGNGAGEQLQFDVYGHVLDATLVCRQLLKPLGGRLLSDLRFLADQAASRWREPDRGIWEMRTGRADFVHSKVMCWVALDRALLLSERGHLTGDSSRWRHERDELKRAILERGYNQDVGAFTQTLDGDALDASVMVIPTVGLLAATDPRVTSTIDRIRERLTRNGLVDRYHVSDGLPGREGSFGLCSFWLVENLALAGRVEEGRALFERIVSHANDLGLLSEEIDPVSGELLGNFPQGFTHLGLIRAALYLERAVRVGAETQPMRAGDRAQQIAGRLGRRSSGDH